MPRYLRGIFLCFLGAGLSQPTLLHALCNFEGFEPTSTLHVNEPKCRKYSAKKWEQQTKALAWHGKGEIRCGKVPDPKIEQPRDAIIKVTACAICGSDLHIYGGIIPDMKKGDVLGHENWARS